LLGWQDHFPLVLFFRQTAYPLAHLLKVSIAFA